ncbi:MAG: ABC transporter ATP-binding protein, partial [Clostridia bacterium]|nr:ABC transporter ATP-binding protein [Clostridia bacterium]
MTAEPAILTERLTKHYRVHERPEGLAAALRDLFRRHYRTVEAVRDVSFAIAPGEVVGLLGPNGAGKTTILKVLTGLLRPSSGNVSVLGFRPWRRERAFLRRIAFVMGQKTQLIWDLPAVETFALHRAVYDLSPSAYRRTLAELSELLDLRPLVHKPVRQLSLGERMRCELAAALLHEPEVLFLDEPTLGLDVVAQARIREFVKEYNRLRRATVLLTSHYMDDVVALCRRVLVVHHGRLLYDGSLEQLTRLAAPYKVVRLTLAATVSRSQLEAFG